MIVLQIANIKFGLYDDVSVENNISVVGFQVPAILISRVQLVTIPGRVDPRSGPHIR